MGEGLVVPAKTHLNLLILRNSTKSAFNFLGPVNCFQRSMSGATPSVFVVLRCSDRISRGACFLSGALALQADVVHRRVLQTPAGAHRQRPLDAEHPAASPPRGVSHRLLRLPVDDLLGGHGDLVTACKRELGRTGSADASPGVDSAWAQGRCKVI